MQNSTNRTKSYGDKVINTQMNSPARRITNITNRPTQGSTSDMPGNNNGNTSTPMSPTGIPDTGTTPDNMNNIPGTNNGMPPVTNGTGTIPRTPLIYGAPVDNTPGGTSSPGTRMGTPTNRGTTPATPMQGGMAPGPQMGTPMPGGMAPGSQMRTPMPGGAAPRAPMRTPMPGGMAPGPQMGTPMPGGMTPGSPMRTPMQGGMAPGPQMGTPMQGGMTPGPQMGTPMQGGMTPGPQMGTPMQGGMAPSQVPVQPPYITCPYYPGSINPMYMPGNTPYNVPMGIPLYPMYGYDNSEDLDKDLEYMKQLYPNTAKNIQKEMTNECDRLEYDGSFMYDEYPDKTSMDKIIDRVYEKVKDVEEEPQLETNSISFFPRRRSNFLRDIVTLVFLNELFNRRRRHRSRSRWF